MARPTGLPDDDRANLALASFLRSSDPAEVSRTLAHLVDEVARPIIRRVLAQKLGPGTNAQAELEDVASEAKERLLERLLILRSDASAPRPARRQGQEKAGARQADRAGRGDKHPSRGPSFTQAPGNTALR